MRRTLKKSKIMIITKVRVSGFVGEGEPSKCPESHFLNGDDGYVSICFISYMCFMVAIICICLTPSNKR